MKLKLPDDRAHQLVSEILDGAEDRIVNKGLCRPEEASDYLTVVYIRECGSFIEHSVVYLSNDERLAAEIFLHSLASAKQARRLSGRISRMCALQLQNNTLMYFPNYHQFLRLALGHVLAERAFESDIARSGVIMLAVATLPSALTDIRRELRRRGYSTERTIICEKDLVTRMSNVEEQLRLRRSSSYFH